MSEYDRKVLDVLREPLESGKVNISRAARQTEFPANFQLIGAMNPSPTGDTKDKRSTPDQMLRYLNRLSGPFVDRLDLQVDVPQLSEQELKQNRHQRGDSSQAVKQRIYSAYHKQMERQGTTNGRLDTQLLEQHSKLVQADSEFLRNAMLQLKLSTRSYHKILRVALTIADLDGDNNIKRPHIAEALQYRAFDRLLTQLTG